MTTAQTWLSLDRAPQNVDDLTAMNPPLAEPTAACGKATASGRSLNHYLFDTLYHALALTMSNAVLVTADRRHSGKADI